MDGMIFLLPLAAILLFIVLMVVLIHNGFVSGRNNMRNAFAAIDVQLKKRWDLIPNLVATVQAFATHEQETFEQITAARKAAQSIPAESPQRFAQEEHISAGVSRLLVVAEAYPDLRSGEQFLHLQRNLTEIESQISAARRAYNAAVTNWNNQVESFPGSLFARRWNFERANWFEVKTGAEQEAVAWKLN